MAALCLGLALLHAAHAATTTIYAADPYNVVAPTSTSTFKSALLSTSSPGNDCVLSPDGETLYCLNSYIATGPIVATDVATGATVQTYYTQGIILGGSNIFAVLPNGSLWVATCGSFFQTFMCYDGLLEVFDTTSGQEVANRFHK
ncbi:MAG TPA: hypothetical protein VMQ86_22735 [Bryobacteraceae bacterium]|jgi:hypothetical protein|nr:hypothetical protein [Bryobacteraceae bacterium]